MHTYIHYITLHTYIHEHTYTGDESMGSGPLPFFQIDQIEKIHVEIILFCVYVTIL